MVDRLLLPASTDEAVEVGFDLDEDAAHDTDNALGEVLSNLHWAVDLDFAVGEASINGGGLLWIVEVQTCAVQADDHARVSLHRGIDTDADPTNNFSGDALLSIGTSGGIPAVGKIDKEGRVRATRGEAVAPLSPLFEQEGSEADVQWSSAAAVTTDLVRQGDGSLTGRLGFALPQDPASEILARVIAGVLNEIVQDDPGCPDACGAQSESALNLFDSDMDGRITDEEILFSTLSPLGPDIDLVADYDGNAVFWPRHDGIKDHLSLGLTVHAVPVMLVDE